MAGLAIFSAIPARLFQRGKLAGRQRQWARRDAGGQGRSQRTVRHQSAWELTPASDETFVRQLLLNTTRRTPDPQARGPLAAAVQHNARARRRSGVGQKKSAVPAEFRVACADWVSGSAVPSLPQRLEYFAISCFAISQLPTHLGNSNATACALRLIISACPYGRSLIGLPP